MRNPNPKRKNLKGTQLKPFNKYRQARTPKDYLEQRMEHKESGCIEFTGGKDKDGYGQVQAARVAKDIGVSRAHQMSYRVYKGDIPKGLYVCHTCDNPSCINPDHLFLGTNQDNMNDMVAKGRYKSGAKSKFTEEEYNEIVSLKGVKHAKEVAEEFGLSWGLVYAYWRGEKPKCFQAQRK